MKDTQPLPCVFSSFRLFDFSTFCLLAFSSFSWQNVNLSICQFVNLSKTRVFWLFNCMYFFIIFKTFSGGRTRGRACWLVNWLVILYYIYNTIGAKKELKMTKWRIDKLTNWQITNVVGIIFTKQKVSIFFPTIFFDFRLYLHHTPLTHSILHQNKYVYALTPL